MDEEDDDDDEVDDDDDDSENLGNVCNAAGRVPLVEGENLARVDVDAGGYANLETRKWC